MSKCKYCGAKVSWIKRPTGGWFPPFEYDAIFEMRDYVLEWNGTDWVGTTVDAAPMTAKATRHYCDQSALLENEPESEPIIQYKTVYREIIRTVRPTPEQWIRQALRLQEDCPVCYAEPFTWCYSVNDPDTQLKVLHTQRGN